MAMANSISKWQWQWQTAMVMAIANGSSGQQTTKEVRGSMLDGWRGFGVARRGLSALARGVDTHDIIPTPPFRILSLTSSEKASLFQSPATILGRKSPSAALSKLGYSAQVGSPTICGVFCIKVDNKLRNKSVLVLEPVESQGGRIVARKRGTSTCRLIRSLKDYVLCRHSFRAPAENGHIWSRADKGK